MSRFQRPEDSSLRESISACLDNAKRLLEDGEWSHRPSTGLALVLLAQEECAKAFLLILVHDRVIPWCHEVNKSLRIHNCKYVVLIFLEWLASKHASREAACLNSRPQPPLGSSGLPPEVAKAMNIYRHEMLEGNSRGSSIPDAEWNGEARSVAKGKRDRRKQDALYIGIGRKGGVTSRPSTSIQEFEKEASRTAKITAFTGAARTLIFFDFPEYERFKKVFGSMLKDLDPDFDKSSVKESYTSSIPGLVFVRRMITVADVEDGDASAEINREGRDKL